MKVISIANEKGGVGKTTAAVSLAAILQKKHKKRVLFIDSDVQCNSSHWYRANLADGTATLYDIVIADEPTPIRDVIQITPMGSIIPSDPLLSQFDSRNGRQMVRLKHALAEIKDEWDYVIIDCPPTSWDILKAVFIASDAIVVPTKASQFGMEGLWAVWPMIRAVRDGANSKLHITGILISEYEKRKAVLENVRIIKEKFCPMMETSLFSRPIRRTIAVEEATMAREALINYSPYCTAEMDFEAVAEELLKREGDL